MPRQTPTFTLESERLRRYPRIAGVDEVGVAPLAGPVVAAAVVLDPKRVGRLRSSRKWGYGVRDSKALSHTAPETLATQIIRHSTSLRVGSASVREVSGL